jgi:broad-specificity NMP kinase
MRCEPEGLALPRRDGSPPLIVELLGVPGAGKTTISRELVSLLGAREVRAHSIVSAGRARGAASAVGRALARRRSSRTGRVVEWQLFSIRAAFAVVPFARSHRGLTRRVLMDQLGRDIPVGLRIHIVRNFLRLCGRYRCITERPGATEALVLDDGFVHRAVQVHASAFEDVDLARVGDYIGLVPPPDLVVFVTAHVATCEQRVRERGVWRHSRRLSTAQLARYLRNAEIVVTAAADHARRLGWNVVQIDNDGRALDEVRRELDDSLPFLGFPTPAAAAVRAGATA